MNGPMWKKRDGNWFLVDGDGEVYAKVYGLRGKVVGDTGHTKFVCASVQDAMKKCEKQSGVRK